MHFITFVSLILILATSNGQAAQHRYAKEATVIVSTGDSNQIVLRANDPRPLDQITLLLNSSYNYLLDYEDPPYMSKNELTGSVTKEWLAQGGAEYYVPNGGEYEVQSSRSEVMSDGPNEKVFLTRMLESYARTSNPGFFELISEPRGRFSIVGKAMRNDSGYPVSSTPLLGYSVRLGSEKQSAYSALLELVSQLQSASGITIKLGTLPYNLLRSTIYSAATKPESARIQLAAILDATKEGLAWSLLYDANDRSYVLNLASVGHYQTSETGSIHFASRQR